QVNERGGRPVYREEDVGRVRLGGRVRRPYTALMTFCGTIPSSPRPAPLPPRVLMRMTSLPSLALLSLLAGSLLADAPTKGTHDWPQWRGPDRTGISKETHLLKTWPKDGPKVLWKYEDAGASYSGPAIVGDRLYCCGSDEQREYVFALNVKTGK